MVKNLGFIGVGHFAEFLVEGFRNKCSLTNIILSPRNRERASLIAERFNCRIAADNQQVADEADVVIIAVRPDVFTGVTKEITFRNNQTVISVVSGIQVSVIEKMVAPANAVRALPVSCAAINQSPTLMMPANETAKVLLENLGTVHVMSDEGQFTAAATYSALYGWCFRLLDEAASWGAQNGLEKRQALELLQELLSGASSMAKKDAHIPMDKIVESLATKGGITELGLHVIDKQNGFEAWHAALDAVCKKLSDNG